MSPVCHVGAGVEESLHGLQGDLHSQPETGNYTFKQVMQAQNTTYEIDLCPSQLKKVPLAFPPHECHMLLFMSKLSIQETVHVNHDDWEMKQDPCFLLGRR